MEDSLLCLVVSLTACGGLIFSVSPAHTSATSVLLVIHQSRFVNLLSDPARFISANEVWCDKDSLSSVVVSKRDRMALKCLGQE
jgi:hypothetical protein